MDLKAWFDSLTYNKILKMAGEPESQVMDCKTVGEEAHTKRNLGVALSGFSNAEGGVVLWGVSAKKSVAGIDCIDAFPGIANARQLASRLDELTPQAVSPGVQGVVHRAILSRGAEGRGFVATFVPASERGPHMARFGEDRYFQRIGLSFSRMEPFQIADMFGRRPRPDLVVDSVKWNQWEYRVRITNCGRGSARGLFLEIGVPPPFVRNDMGIDGNRKEVLPFINRNTDGTWLHAADAAALLHPTMSLQVGGVWLGYDVGPLLARGEVPQKIHIAYKVGALDIEPKSGEIEIDLKAPAPADYF